MCRQRFLKRALIHIADVADAPVQRGEARFVDVEADDAKTGARQFDGQGQAHVAQSNDPHHSAALLNTLQEFGSCTLHHFCSVFPLVAKGVDIAVYLTTWKRSSILDDFVYVGRDPSLRSG